MTNDPLKSVTPDFPILSTMICVLLLPEGISLKKNGGRFVILLCFCTNLQLIS